MEFDSEGRIIVPGNVRDELDKEKRGIILNKIQVTTRSPAIAQLKINFGKDIPNQNNLMYEMKRFCDAFNRLNFHDVDKEIKSNEGYIIIESKSSLRMYSFLSGMIEGIKERFNNYPIVIRGTWISAKSFI